MRIPLRVVISSLDFLPTIFMELSRGVLRDQFAEKCRMVTTQKHQSRNKNKPHILLYYIYIYIDIYIYIYIHIYWNMYWSTKHILSSGFSQLNCARLLLVSGSSRLHHEAFHRRFPGHRQVIWRVSWCRWVTQFDGNQWKSMVFSGSKARLVWVHGYFLGQFQEVIKFHHDVAT